MDQGKLGSTMKGFDSDLNMLAHTQSMVTVHLRNIDEKMGGRCHSASKSVGVRESRGQKPCDNDSVARVIYMKGSVRVRSRLLGVRMRNESILKKLHKRIKNTLQKKRIKYSGDNFASCMESLTISASIEVLRQWSTPVMKQSCFLLSCK